MQNLKATPEFVSLGAGVQSTAMLLMADRGLIDPTPKAAIFADTGWEPESVYRQLDWLEETVKNIPIMRINEGRHLLRESQQGITKSGRVDTIIPAYYRQTNGKATLVASRECTREYKVRPIARAIGQLIGRPRGARGESPGAIQWLGISLDEIMRMKESQIAWISNRWPLIELRMTRSDCAAWLTEKYPNRPFYKSSCVGCAFHSDREWLRLAREHPDQMEAVIQLDERLRSAERPRGNLRGDAFLHRSGKPLRQALAELRERQRQNPPMAGLDDFNNECEGYCGV